MHGWFVVWLKGMSAIFMARLSKNTMNIVGKNVVV